MITREEILTASADKSLVETIAAQHRDQHNALADLLSVMHNTGEIDILAGDILGGRYKSALS